MRGFITGKIANRSNLWLRLSGNQQQQPSQCCQESKEEGLFRHNLSRWVTVGLLSFHNSSSCLRTSQLYNQ